MLKASVLITSYNQKRTLELLFKSLERQTEKNFEVVVADDGSSDGTDLLCQSQKAFPVTFSPQADIGYRKAKAVNKAIAKVKTDYIIFVDGDVILEKHFIEDHLALRKKDYFVCGRRVELGPDFSESISVEMISKGRFDSFNWELFKSVRKNDSEHFNRSLRVTHPVIRKLFKYDEPLDILGSNFSAWKKDLLDINGFNESLESYWGEDGDLFIRLRNSGKKSVGAKAICVQFHVFHKRREPTKENVARYEKLLKDHEYRWAKQGLTTPAPE